MSKFIDLLCKVLFRLFGVTFSNIVYLDWEIGPFWGQIYLPTWLQVAMVSYHKHTFQIAYIKANHGPYYVHSSIYEGERTFFVFSIQELPLNTADLVGRFGAEIVSGPYFQEQYAQEAKAEIEYAEAEQKFFEYEEQRSMLPTPEPQKLIWCQEQSEGMCRNTKCPEEDCPFRAREPQTISGSLRREFGISEKMASWNVFAWGSALDISRVVDDAICVTGDPISPELAEKVRNFLETEWGWVYPTH